MIVGFTGTRNGMTAAQYASVYDLITDLKITEGHHGDCHGSDFQFDMLLKTLKIKRIVHPPIKTVLRAYCDGDVILEPKEYLERDRDIATCCQTLIATPRSINHQKRSGTWFTIRYAQEELKRNVYIVFPDGTVTFTGNK